MGPSIWSHEEIAHPLVGFSTFNCVPNDKKLPEIPMVAGCTEAAEKPLTLLSPYLNLKLPERDGCPKTGLPATRSLIYVGELSAEPFSRFLCSAI